MTSKDNFVPAIHKIYQEDVDKLQQDLDESMAKMVMWLFRSPTSMSWQKGKANRASQKRLA
jgi:hypothetical protein